MFMVGFVVYSLPRSWFGSPGAAGSWNRRRWVLTGDLVSKGSSSPSALQDGPLMGGLLSRASNIYI